MSKKQIETRAYRKGIVDTLFSIAGIGIWVIIIMAYGYMKFM